MTTPLLSSGMRPIKVRHAAVGPVIKLIAEYGARINPSRSDRAAHRSNFFVRGTADKVRGADDGIKPGVKRSETPGLLTKKISQSPREAADSASITKRQSTIRLSAAPRASDIYRISVPGVERSGNPGPQVEE